jgi:hypothetical protein
MQVASEAHCGVDASQAKPKELCVSYRCNSELCVVLTHSSVGLAIWQMLLGVHHQMFVKMVFVTGPEPPAAALPSAEVAMAIIIGGVHANSFPTELAMTWHVPSCDVGGTMHCIVHTVCEVVSLRQCIV